MKSILCAIDGSERAAGVVAAASELARGMGAKLTLFRAISIPPEISHDLYRNAEATLHGVLMTQAEKALTEFAARFPEPVPETRIETGTSWDAICRTAQKLECDLIVLGSHGFGTTDRFLGTTAMRVVSEASCSVLVIRIA